ILASDLQRLSEDLQKARKQYDQYRADLKKKEAQLMEAYKGKVPPELLKPLQDAYLKIKQTEDKSDAGFREARCRLFQRLYHEAFHAYVSNFVYPEKDGELPLWLNEGLAQIFESASVEVGGLRVGQADRERLTRVQAALHKHELLPLADLLRA